MSPNLYIKYKTTTIPNILKMIVYTLHDEIYGIKQFRFERIDFGFEFKVRKLGILDGYQGFMIAIHTAYGKFLKYIKLRELNKQSGD